MAKTNDGKVLSFTVAPAKASMPVREAHHPYRTKTATTGQYVHQRVSMATNDRPFHSKQTTFVRVHVEEWETAEAREDERRWADAFARTPELLAALVAEAQAERRAGRTKPLDPDAL